MGLHGQLKDGAYHPAAPGKRIDAFAAGEHVTEVRLIAKAAFEADLREAQVSVLNQQLGPGDALLANPFLGRIAGAAFERTGEMTAREGAGPGQFGDFQAVSQAIQDQLLHQPFALWAEAATAGVARFADRGAGEGLQ